MRQMALEPSGSAPDTQGWVGGKLEPYRRGERGHYPLRTFTHNARPAATLRDERLPTVDPPDAADALLPSTQHCHKYSVHTRT
jgi:hypothetical protein